MASLETNNCSANIEPEQDDKFIIKEYEESSKAYFNGVDIGIGYIRLFFIINAVFLTSIGTLLRVGFGGDFDIYFNFSILFISIFGALLSVKLNDLIDGYDEQLKNCLDRCVVLERKFGGKLFHAIQLTSNRETC